MSDSDKPTDFVPDPDQLDLGFDHPEAKTGIVRTNRRNALDKSVFRQDRSVLLAKNLFVLNPKNGSTLIQKFDGGEQSASVIFTTTVQIDKDTTVTYRHPPLGPNEQRVLHGLVLLADGDLRGSSRTFNSSDSSQYAKWAWRQLGPESQAFGGAILVLSPSKNQLTEAVKLGRSRKSLSSRDTNAVLESLSALSQVLVELRTKNEAGKEVVAGAHLVSSYRSVDDQITITVNPRIMNAVMGIPGSFSLISAEELKHLKSDASSLLFSRLCALVDGGSTKRFRDETIEGYIWGDVIPIDNEPQHKIERKSRRRTIVRAFDELTSVGWIVTYNKGSRAGEGYWEVTRPAVSNPLSGLSSPSTSQSEQSEAPPARKRRAKYKPRSGSA